VESRIVRCRSCGLFFPDPFPVPVDPQELYADPERYFAHHDETAKIEGQRETAREIRRRTGLANPRVLEVGCGRGEFLRAAELEGLDVVGLELSEAMVNAAGARGLTVRRELIEEHEGAYDAFVLNAVLEHVHDPDSMISAVARLSRGRSVLLIDVPVEPNLLTWSYRLTHRRSVLNLAPTFPPYHVWGFNPKALRMLLDKHGFELTDVQRVAYFTIPGSGPKVLAARALARIANVTGTASNMTCWARRR
jgi:2-polyprenyl-3-methyl-5-hydroxy-6-metoxy-1,4-benzoquinol methylase